MDISEDKCLPTLSFSALKGFTKTFLGLVPAAAVQDEIYDTHHENDHAADPGQNHIIIVAEEVKHN